MSRKRPPAYQLHKATGQACVKIDGKFVYLGRHGTEESRKRYADVIGGNDAPLKFVPAPSLTVKEMLHAFLLRNPSEYPNSSDEPRQFPIALTSVVKLLGHLPAADVQAHHLADVRRAMEHDGLSRGVINRRLARIKLAFRRSELWGIIPPGVYARLAVVRGTDTRAKASPPVEPAVFADVLAVVRALRNRGKGQWIARRRTLTAMLLLGWWTGARPGELRIMRPCDIDRAGPVWIYRPSTHKNAWRNQSREIPLGPKCQSVLSPLLKSLSPSTWVFLSRTGNPYTVNGLASAIHDAAEAAGVSLHAYQLRHASKRRIEQAHGENAAKAFLGQESLDSTRRYARGQDTELAKRIAGKAG